MSNPANKLPVRTELRIIADVCCGIPMPAVAKTYSVSLASVSKVMRRNGYVRKWVKIQ